MVRALSPDSATIANDLIDQGYDANHIASTVNNMRTQQGQDTLPAFGQPYAHWARTYEPENPTPYNARDVSSFGQSRASASMPQALSELPPRASGSSRPPSSRYTQAIDSSSGRVDTASEVSRLASDFSASQLTAALIRQHNPNDFSGDPLPSGESVPSQSFTSDSESELHYSDLAGYPGQGLLAPDTFPASSTGRPQRRTARQDARTAPYPAPSSLPSGSDVAERTVRPHIWLTPALPEHTELLQQLPAGAIRSNINRFLCYLEQQDTSWSQVAPANGGMRPAALEQAVNTGIREHGLHESTRGSLNRGFGLVLQGESGRVRNAPILQEHIALMNELPPGLRRTYRSPINVFLCHLERQGTSWSNLVPDRNDLRPAALEQEVNASMRVGGLNSGTRAALNQAFGLFLQGETGRVRLAPTLPEHTALMGALPPELSQTYRSHISRFLCHLELRGNSWSHLVPAGSGARPAELEGVVNLSISNGEIQGSTRAALNQAFGFELRP